MVETTYGGAAYTSYVSHIWVHDNVFSFLSQGGGYGASTNLISEGGDGLRIGFPTGTGGTNPATATTGSNQHITVENNLIAGVGHAPMDSYGTELVVKNNVIHNEPWYPANNMGLVPGYAPTGYLNAAYNGLYGHRCYQMTDDFGRPHTHNLLEGNRIGYGSVNPNNDGADCMDLAAPENIVRYNCLYGAMNNGLMFKYGYNYTSGNGGCSNRVYNNTIYTNGWGYPYYATSTNGFLPKPMTGIYYYYVNSKTFGNVIKNNIISGSYSASMAGRYWDIYPTTNNIVTNNFVSANGDPCFVNPDVSATASTVLPNLNLRQASPAIGQGIPLTQAVGDGTQSCALAAADVLYFQDGTWGADLTWGVTLFPDWVAVGTATNVVEIQSINYANNTITLKSPITWHDRDPIWLYKNSSGQQVLFGTSPDIGAAPYPYRLTVTAASTNIVSGQPLPLFTASYAGFLNGDTPGALGGALTFYCPATTNSPPGTYPITPGGLTSTNYIIAFSNGTLTIVNGLAITASAGQHGAIAPSGTVDVIRGDAQTFTNIPAAWYGVAGVVVDGIPVGAVDAYTFSNVTTSHAITTTFAALLAPLGTPEWWLAQYGWTNNFAVAETNLDSDGDAVWQDYLTGTNPTNPLFGPTFNVVPYAQGFENLNGWGGVYTNVAGAMGWYSGAGDQSRIANLLYTYTATNLPLPDDTHTNVLQINTGASTLTNSFGTGFDMSGGLLYLDMMMQFVPGFQAPAQLTASDFGIKGAVGVTTNYELAVYHGVAASTGALLSNTVDVTSVGFASNTWHRLTLIVDATATNQANFVAMFQVLLDGVVVTNAHAYANGWKAQFDSTGVLPSTVSTGTWFRFATTNAATAATNLVAIGFMGSGGYADDIMVTTVNPFPCYSGWTPCPQGGMCPLIVTSSGSGCCSLGTGPYVAAMIASGASTQILYTAAEWNRITTLVSDGAPLIAASGAHCFTQTVVNIGAGISNDVAYALATPMQTGFTNVPTSWLTNWTEKAVQGALGRDGFSLHDKYQLGLDPTSSNTFGLTIDGVSFSGSNLVITVRRTATGALAPNGMNGNLMLETTYALTNAFTNLPATAVTGPSAFDATGLRAYTNAVDAPAKLYRTVVQ